jgi:hypothetical protein
MGFPPPVNAPPPPNLTLGVSTPDLDAILPSVAIPGVDFSVGLPVSPNALTLCGFTFPPAIFFDFGFSLGGFEFPPKLPVLTLGLSINCSLSNPLSVSAGIKWGGGRASNAPSDPDALEQGS